MQRQISANYNIAAIQIGDYVKYAKSVNEIDRAAQSVCNFERIDFPQNRGSITSDRAYVYLCWIYTIERHKELPLHKRNEILVNFTKLLFEPSEYTTNIEKIFIKAGVLVGSDDFDNRNFHPLIVNNSRKLFIETNYFHAVFEATKLYNKMVKQKSGLTKDGSQLMMDAFGDKGLLKHNNGKTTSEIDELNGIKFLSAGLMQALRNPTAHELATEWKINKSDCLDILSFISFLLRKLDDSSKRML